MTPQQLPPSVLSRIEELANAEEIYDTMLKCEINTERSEAAELVARAIATELLQDMQKLEEALESRDYIIQFDALRKHRAKYGEMK